MYCTHCGKEIDDNANFCSYCGATLTADTQFNQNPDAQYYAQRGYQGKGSSQPLEQDDSNMGFSILCFLFPVVGLILYLVWRDQYPLKARSCGIGALVSVIVYFAIIILAILVLIFIGIGMCSIGMAM